MQKNISDLSGDLMTALVSEMKTDADCKLGRIALDVTMSSECKTKSNVCWEQLKEKCHILAFF